MKNTLMIPLVFFANTVVWIVAIAFFSVIGSSRMFEILLAGNRLYFLEILGYRAIFLVPVGFVIAFLATFFYLMRHAAIVYISIPLIGLIAAASVVFVLPKSFELLAFFESHFASAITAIDSRSGNNLLEGAIQPYAGGSWIDLAPRDRQARMIVATQVANDGTALFAYPNARYDRVSGTLLADSLAVPIVISGDSLYARYLSPPPFVTHIFFDFTRLLEAFRASFVQDWRVFLAFTGSFYLVILALWFLCYASSWRLLNVLFVFTSLRLLIYVYPYLVSGSVYQFVMKIRPAVLPAAFVPAAELALIAAVAIVIGSCVAVIRLVRRSSRGAFHA